MRTFHPIALSATVVAAAFSVVWTAQAQPNIAPLLKQTIVQAVKKQNTGAASTIHKELEIVRTQLNQADHDYKGHRAAAVHQITHAIHLLQHGQHHPNPSRHFTAGKGHRESQAKSDAQLRHAIQELNQIAVQLHRSNLPHHAQALTAVKRAIHDLHQALKVA
ncbi:MAG: hypothetical protein WCL32_05935 [Planctomycetota bacterium]